MKINYFDAARKLKLHPCELILKLAHFAKSFNDVYPELDEGFIKTIKQMHPQNYFEEGVSEHESKRKPFPDLSKDAITAICHLKNKKYWGSNHVPIDEINRHCRDINDLDTTLKELMNYEIILQHKGGKTFSLNPKQKKLIYAINDQIGK